MGIIWSYVNQDSASSDNLLSKCGVDNIGKTKEQSIKKLKVLRTSMVGFKQDASGYVQFSDTAPTRVNPASEPYIPGELRIIGKEILRETEE